jgi:hypothetical protein
MTDETADLIAAAETVLRAEVLPHLPPGRRYPALMVAKALGIAARRIAGAGARAAAAADLLEPFVPAAAPSERLRAVSAGLRSGALPATEDLHAALVAIARAETLESNPRARSLGPDQPRNGSDG